MTRALAVCAEAKRSILRSVSAGLESLRAQKPQWLSAWAAANFELAGESSQQKGMWTSWSFQIGIMDFLSDDRIEEVVVQKSKRVGYTKILTAFCAYNIAHRRRNIALWQPTDDDRDSFVKSEIDPVFEVIPAIAKARPKGRAVSEDTMRFKRFKDCVFHILGGKAARAFRRITVAVAMLDEWSGFDQQIEKSGDPGGLAKGRLEGAAYPKFVGGSTPRIKGLDHVERARENCDVDMRFHIDCPHCGVETHLFWGGKSQASGFKWTPGQHDTAHFVCPHCLATITQAHYLPGGLPLPGTWVCIRTGIRYQGAGLWFDSKGMPCTPPRQVGMQIWAIYSPQRTWASIAKENEEARAALEKGDVGPMQLFVNETRGETWELVGDRTDEHTLQKRAEPYPLCTVPTGALVLTAGIDVQRNRWEIAVWGWGRGMESWAIDHHIIEGNPANEEDWHHVTTYLQRRYTQAHHGTSLGISAISIDSSDQSQAVYNWVRSQTTHLPNLRAVKGSSEDHKSVLGPASLVDVTWRGQTQKRGVKLWMTGVDTAKDLLLGQLAIDPPSQSGQAKPGYVHTSQDLPREWYLQLTAEQRILVKANGKDTYRWVKLRGRNEVLDCRNYALHAAYGLGLHTKTDAAWQRLEMQVQPPVDDLFSAPIAVLPTTSTQTQVTPAPRPKPSRPSPPPPPPNAFASGQWLSRL